MIKTILDRYMNMKTTKNKKHNQQGFTLVELSIVLVIIGLIVGGVLVGQDMIKAAEIRSTISQIEKYSTAKNVFKDKYRYIPGDLTGTYATQFGFFARTGATGHGDGNRMLEACGTSAMVYGCETSIFWDDLATANLIDGSFTVVDDLTTACATPDACKAHLPEAKLGRGNMVAVFSAAGQNYYEIHGVATIATATGYTLTHSMSPQEAFNIDDKLDDGNPLQGSVRAMDSSIAVLNDGSTPAVAAVGVCVESTNNTYNTAQEDYANSPSCGLRFKMQ